MTVRRPGRLSGLKELNLPGGIDEMIPDVQSAWGSRSACSSCRDTGTGDDFAEGTLRKNDTTLFRDRSSAR